MISEYPEHDKLAAVREHSQAIGHFLDFGPWRLCEFDRETDQYWPVSHSIEQILAEWFDIDLDRIEAEKRAMLASLRWMNTPARPVERPVQWPAEWSQA